MVKNQNLVKKYEFWSKNPNFVANAKFWSTIKIWSKNMNFDQKIQSLTKMLNFGQQIWILVKKFSFENVGKIYYVLFFSRNNQLSVKNNWQKGKFGIRWDFVGPTLPKRKISNLSNIILLSLFCLQILFQLCFVNKNKIFNQPRKICHLQPFF